MPSLSSTLSTRQPAAYQKPSHMQMARDTLTEVGMSVLSRRQRPEPSFYRPRSLVQDRRMPVCRSWSTDSHRCTSKRSTTEGHHPSKCGGWWI